MKTQIIRTKITELGHGRIRATYSASRRFTLKWEQCLFAALAVFETLNHEYSFVTEGARLQAEGPRRCLDIIDVVVESACEIADFATERVTLNPGEASTIADLQARMTLPQVETRISTLTQNADL